MSMDRSGWLDVENAPPFQASGAQYNARPAYGGGLHNYVEEAPSVRQPDPLIGPGQKKYLSFSGRDYGPNEVAPLLHHDDMFASKQIDEATNNSSPFFTLMSGLIICGVWYANDWLNDTFATDTTILRFSPFHIGAFASLIAMLPLIFMAWRCCPRQDNRIIAYVGQKSTLMITSSVLMSGVLVLFWYTAEKSASTLNVNVATFIVSSPPLLVFVFTLVWPRERADIWTGLGTACIVAGYVLLCWQIPADIYLDFGTQWRWLAMLVGLVVAYSIAIVLLRRNMLISGFRWTLFIHGLFLFVTSVSLSFWASPASAWQDFFVNIGNLPLIWPTYVSIGLFACYIFMLMSQSYFSDSLTMVALMQYGFLFGSAATFEMLRNGTFVWNGIYIAGLVVMGLAVICTVYRVFTVRRRLKTKLQTMQIQAHDYEDAFYAVP